MAQNINHDAQQEPMLSIEHEKHAWNISDEEVKTEDDSSDISSSLTPRSYSSHSLQSDTALCDCLHGSTIVRRGHPGHTCELEDDDDNEDTRTCISDSSSNDIFLECQENTSDNAESFRPAIATMSLGAAGMHSLIAKLEFIATKGFQGVEIFWDDLIVHAAEQAGVAPPPSPKRGSHWDSASFPKDLVLSAATSISELCRELDLTIISLQPFRNYDGIMDKSVHDSRLEEFKFWLQVSECLGNKAIGVPSTIAADPEGPTYTGNPEALANDLHEIADLAKPYGIRIAYENLCFGKHIQSWDQAWDVISRSGAMDCIDFLPDTFNLCGDMYADPASIEGSYEKGEQMLQIGMQALTKTIPLSNLSFLQLADGEFMSPPLGPDHPWRLDGCSHPKMAWSRNARCFPFEENGYLPVLPVVKALVNAGWSGWVSMEVFSRTTRVEGNKTIRDHAERAWNSWEKLAKTMNWPVNPEIVSA